MKLQEGRQHMKTVLTKHRRRRGIGAPSYLFLKKSFHLFFFFVKAVQAQMDSAVCRRDAGCGRRVKYEGDSTQKRGREAREDA